MRSRSCFSGCVNLKEVDIPDGVRAIGDYAFNGCASLERLSLPPGLEALKDESWAEYADLTWYNGDNGTTLPEPMEDEGW